MHNVAAFFNDRAAAERALAHVQERHGRLAGRAVLLGPDDADATRFARQARLWRSRRPTGEDTVWPRPPLSAAIGGLTAAVFAAATLSFSSLLSVPALLALAAALVVAGAALGYAGARWAYRGTRPGGPFDDTLRRHLADGHWAIVAHGLPPARGTAVVAMLQAECASWCAEEPLAHRI